MSNVKSDITSRATPLRVMVVDDSLVLRGIISRMINEEPNIAQVIASASNGMLAVERVKQRDIDVIILDIEMPVLDGISALERIMAIDPTIVVIMASTLTTRNAEISLRALAAGAKDYIPKPSSLTPAAGAAEFKRELIEKITVLGTRFRRLRNSTASPSRVIPDNIRKQSVVSPPPVLKSAAPGRPVALAIGSSTGGPNALQQVLRAMPAPLCVPVFITQHMPATFTAMLAQNLTRETGHKCSEAQHGESVEAGRVYIAPGDYHMTAVRDASRVILRLNQQPKENFCRPAVDPMLHSLSVTYQRPLLVSILTGMGHDGLRGAEIVVKAGGNVVAQDEASSVVWGMPGAVAKAGLCCSIVPLSQMGKELMGYLEKKQ